VIGAARRLGLSSSAMSRTLARLRVVMGDPLFVRAGGGLVPTPRAIELRERVHPLIGEVEAVLSHDEVPLHLATLERTFTIRTNEGFVSLFAAPLLAPWEPRRRMSVFASRQSP
jgi:DNA-binding transcriptional LysR family regulator